MEATSGVERRIEFINTEMYALRRPPSPHVGGRVRHLRASYPHRPSTVCAPHLQKEDGIAPEGEGEGLRDFADKCAHGVSLVSMPACGCVAAAVALCAPLDSTGHKDAARSEQNQGRRLGLLLPLRLAGGYKNRGKKRTSTEPSLAPQGQTLGTVFFGRLASRGRMPPAARGDGDKLQIISQNLFRRERKAGNWASPSGSFLGVHASLQPCNALHLKT